MSDPNQDPRYRSRSYRPPASSEATNQSAYSSSYPGQPVYAPYSGGAQESQLPGHSGSYSTSSHAPGGHTPHVPFPEAPQGQTSLQSRPVEYPETYPSHSSTSYSTQVTPQDPYDSVGYQASGHGQGGHTPHPPFPGQPQRQRSEHRQSEPRGPPENYSPPSQISPHLAGAGPQGSYGSGGHQPASRAQGGYTPDPSIPGQLQPQRSVPRQSEPRGPPDSYGSGGHQPASRVRGGHTPNPSFPGQLQPQRSVPRQSEPRGPPASYSSPSHTSPHLTGATPQDSYGTGGNQLPRSTSLQYSHGSAGPSHPPGVQSSIGGSYNVATAHAQDLDTARYESEKHDSSYREKSPGSKPASTHATLCRFSGCTQRTFFDKRVNEFREWCSEQHMEDAITYRMEKRCKQCDVWPRRNGSRYCSVAVCNYPGIIFATS